MIRSIIEKTGVKIDVEDDGRVNVASSDEAAAAKALGMIQELTATPELNKTYLGKVQRITDFGAFVEIMQGTDGLLHVSEIANYRVKDVRDELKEGQQVLVKVINIDPTGKIRLSRKALLAPDEGTAPPPGVRRRGRAKARRPRLRPDARQPRRQRAPVSRRPRRTRPRAASAIAATAADAAIARDNTGRRPAMPKSRSGNARLRVSPRFQSCAAAAVCIAQDQAPNRRDVTLVARDHQFIPNRIEVVQDDLVRITFTSEGRPTSFAVDAYRILKRAGADKTIVFEFRADQAGTFHLLLQSHQRSAVQGHEGHARRLAEVGFARDASAAAQVQRLRRAPLARRLDALANRRMRVEQPLHQAATADPRRGSAATAGASRR